MNGQGVTQADVARSQLRVLVATISDQIGHIPREKVFIDDGESRASGLTAAWAELVKQLDLGAEPELRECPVCKGLGMRAATRCGYCWTVLSQLEKAKDVTA